MARFPFGKTDATRIGELLALALGAGACAVPSDGVARRTATTVYAPLHVSAELRAHTPSREGCETVPVFAYGAPAGAVCADDVEREGLTLIDLGDAWTPRVFAPHAAAKALPAYRATYLELAAQYNADLGLHGPRCVERALVVDANGLVV